jgi:hypothetical protein
MSMKRFDNIVQLLNPKTLRYVKVDRVNARILSTKKTPGPYKNIQIIKRKTIKTHAILKGC